MLIRWPFQALLLSILVLLLFYPSLSAQVCLVDDQEVLNALYNATTITIKDTFLPGSANGGYYRPFIGLSYYLDSVVWDFNLRAMHLDNIIMHIINVLLLFSIMHLLLSRKEGINSYIPLLTASLFAVHPIVTESVNWISGRTDPMAGNFVLAATFFLLLYRRHDTKKYLIAAVISILLGICSKEASFGMLLAAGFILKAEDKPDTNETNDYGEQQQVSAIFKTSGLPFLLLIFAICSLVALYTNNYWLVLAVCGFYYLALLFERQGLKLLSNFDYKKYVLLWGGLPVAISLFIFLRRLAFKSDVSKIGQTITLMFQDMNYSISVFLGASGFYIKKFLAPLPLNFFVIEIDPLYDLLGILLLLFCLRLITRLDLMSAFFLAGVCMFLPALPFAFGTIAWTGYAERYIYISTAFWIIAAGIFVDAHFTWQMFNAKICAVAAASLLIFFSWQTYSRNIVWQKNVSLLENSVKQSPKVKTLRDMYMYALYVAGNKDAAKQQYTVGKSLYSFGYDPSADFIMAQMIREEGHLEEALKIYESAVNKSKNNSEKALKEVIRHLSIMLSSKEYVAKYQSLSKKKRVYELLLGNLSTDPMTLYSLGKNALAKNDMAAALEYFVHASSKFSPDSDYKRYSDKLIVSLKKEQF